MQWRIRLENTAYAGNKNVSYSGKYLNPERSITMKYGEYNEDGPDRETSGDDNDQSSGTGAE